MAKRLGIGLRMAGLLAFLFLSYQNCTPTGKPPGSTEQKSQSSEWSFRGGDGYDGKLFINSPLGAICSDGYKVQSAVLIANDNSAYKVRDNCQDITPQLIPPSQFSYMPHNPKNLIFVSRTFDLNPAVSLDLRTTTWLCRGSETAEYYRIIHGITLPATFRDRWGDIVIKPQPNGGHTARMIVGFYAQGSVSQLTAPIYDSGEFPIQMDDSGIITFTGIDSNGFQLSILGTNGKAMRTLDPQNIDPFREPDPDINLNINCYPQ